jgi:hypothetical protein
MVFWRIVDKFRAEPSLPEGPAKLPDYFPVIPRGCETYSQKLFECMNEKAVPKQRDMEKAGFHKSYFSDVTVEPEDEDAAKLALESDDPRLPKPDDHPLDLCRSEIAYYSRCCSRELKKRKNWILTEPYRVQEEYRWDLVKDKPDIVHIYPPKKK